MAQINMMSGLVANNGLELLTAGTPNGFKISILLEELKEAYGKDYSYQNIDIFERNVQKEAWFTKLGPNGRIPVLVDHDRGGYAIMETIAILNYLSHHYDPEKMFCFDDPMDICTAEQWMAWQHAGLGPMQAQANFYYRFCSHRYPFPTQRFVGETERLYGVLNTRLTNRQYLAGSGNGKYSIADIAIWPFINASAVTGIELEKFPSVYQWWERISNRSAVQKGLKIPTGKEFPFGYKTILERAREDPQWVESENNLKQELKIAQKEFGYEYKSP